MLNYRNSIKQVGIARGISKFRHNLHIVYMRYALCYLFGTVIQNHNLIVTKVDTQLRVMNSEGFHVYVVRLNGQHVGLSKSQWLSLSTCRLALCFGWQSC